MEKSNFKVDFRVPEVFQWLDLEITLHMAFGRARGDFSRPKSGTWILDHPLWNACSLLTEQKLIPDRAEIIDS